MSSTPGVDIHAAERAMQHMTLQEALSASQPAILSDNRAGQAGTAADSTSTRHTDAPIDLLPPELLGLCFIELPAPCRFHISLVSRHWREVALATPQLWDTLVLNHAIEDRDLLRSVISRSGAVPLTVALHPGSGFSNGLTLLASALCLPNDLEIRPVKGSYDDEAYVPAARPVAPFFVTGADFGGQFTVLARKRPGESVPGRRSVSVFSSVFSADCSPYPTPYSLQGRMAARPGALSPDAGRLFEFFPQLVSITLTRVRSESLLPDGAVPPQLKFLTLSADNDFVDYDRFCLGLRGLPKKDLRLSLSSGFLPPVMLYTKYIQQPFTMSGQEVESGHLHAAGIGNVFEVVLNVVDEADGAPWLVFAMHACGPSRQALADATNLLHNLEALWWPADKFVGFLKVSATLPSLRHLRLGKPRNLRRVAGLHLETCGVLRVPNLLVLYMDCFPALDEREMRDALKWFLGQSSLSWLSFALPKLYSVDVLVELSVAEDPELEPLELRCSTLLSSAERVYVGRQPPDHHSDAAPFDGVWLHA